MAENRKSRADEQQLDRKKLFMDYSDPLNIPVPDGFEGRWSSTSPTCISRNEATGWSFEVVSETDRLSKKTNYGLNRCYGDLIFMIRPAELGQQERESVQARVDYLESKIATGSGHGNGVDSLPECRQMNQHVPGVFGGILGKTYY